MIQNIEVREMRLDEIHLPVDYFLSASLEFLELMGADIQKLPNRNSWLELMESEFKKDLTKKQFYYVVWLIDGKLVGHSNINKIQYGKEAFMHLHMWNTENRQKGAGYQLVKKSISYYFENFQLQNLFCEPHALNPAPNKTLPKVGFIHEKAYETTPGWINFHQKVNRWSMSYEQYERLLR